MDKYLKNIALFLCCVLLLLGVVNLSVSILNKMSTSGNDLSANTVTPEVIKQNLIGKSLFQWGIVESKHIHNCRVLDIKTASTTTNCFIILELDNQMKNNPAYFLKCNYIKNVLKSIEVETIEYDNPLAFKEMNEYAFKPLPECTIRINTKGKNILVKTCLDCTYKNYKTAEDASLEIPITDFIAIKSNDTDIHSIKMIYTPVNTQITNYP